MDDRGSGHARPIGGRIRFLTDKTALIALLFVCILLSGPLTAQAQQGSHPTVPIALELDPELHLGNGTYLVGTITFSRDIIRHPGIVGATGLDTPGGALVVCPIERGAQGVLPSLAAIGTDCSEGRRFEEPVVGFGNRTWLQFEGSYRGTAPAGVSINLFTPDGPHGGALWLTVPGSRALTVAHGAEALRFVAVTSASQVLVTESDETHHYNGTDWAFVFEKAGTSTLHGAGFHATMESTLDLTLRRGDIEGLDTTKQPRVFIDLQQHLHGQDARESIGNATRHFTPGLIPHFHNAAILGNINGTVGRLEAETRNGTLVHGTEFRLRLDGTTLEGTGDVRFVLYGRSLWIDAEEPRSAPWGIVIFLWVVAGIAILIGLPWGPLRPRIIWLERAFPIVGLLLWDRVLARLLETSALNVLASGEPVVWALRLGVLEGVSFLMGWFLLYVPLRTVLRRGSPDRWRPIALVAYPIFLIYLWLAPGAILEMGRLIVRF